MTLGLLVISTAKNGIDVSTKVRNTAAGDISVPTFHYTETRLGWNSLETILNPTSVNGKQFGKQWQVPTDGLVWGSPVILAGVSIFGGPRTVLYAATDRNSVYALDAENGKVLWTKKELAKPLNDAQYTGTWFQQDMHGVLSTPVLDPQSQTLYVCGIAQKGLSQQYRLWALNAKTGDLRQGFPILIEGQDRGRKFKAGELNQRGALSFLDGWVLIPFGGRGDVPPWRGWLAAVDTQHPTSPARLLCTSPAVDGAGIWSGAGVSAESIHEVYAATGNGTYDLEAGGTCAAETILKLDITKPLFGLDLKSPYGRYTPKNWAFLDEEDEDFGGATPIVLPTQSEGGEHLLFSGGKDGVAYLMNRDCLGGVGGELQRTRLFCPEKADYHEGIRSTSAYFDAGLDGRYIYVAGDDPGPNATKGLAAMRLARTGNLPGHVGMNRSWTLTRDLDGPSSPIVSSNGPKDGIVWVVETKEFRESCLLAYEALTGRQLYSSSEQPTDGLVGGRRFTSPVAANGHVYVGALGIFCYGVKN